MKNNNLNTEFINFDEFVEYSKEVSEYPYWSFKYKGYPVTHISDTNYLIIIENVHLNFKENQILSITSHLVELKNSLTGERIVFFYINQK